MLLFGSDPKLAPLLNRHILIRRRSVVAKMCALNERGRRRRAECARPHLIDCTPESICGPKSGERRRTSLRLPEAERRRVFADDPIVPQRQLKQAGNIITPSHFLLKEDAMCDWKGWMFSHLIQRHSIEGNDGGIRQD